MMLVTLDARTKKAPKNPADSALLAELTSVDTEVGRSEMIRP